MKKISLNKFLIVFLVLTLLIIGCEKATQLIFQVDAKSCTACGECIQACPTDAIEIIDNKAIIDQTKCIQCGDCVDACPEGAIY
ncbi:MAG: 4Fe-4S binding protein [Candidatus Cloacimonadota bacterium]|nr:4Fe-4S binding protein [Candidatus Cloacimonadota bacterium]